MLRIPHTAVTTYYVIKIETAPSGAKFSSSPSGVHKMARRTATAPREAIMVINEDNERVPRGELRYTVILNRRDEYWWQAGPVDS